MLLLLPLPAIVNILYLLQDGNNTTGKLHVLLLSSSDHSDIVTLGDSKEEEHVEEEQAAANEEFYLGTPCSSQYTFTAAETGRSPATHTHTRERDNIERFDTQPFFLCLFSTLSKQV